MLLENDRMIDATVTGLKLEIVASALKYLCRKKRKKLQMLSKAIRAHLLSLQRLPFGISRQIHKRQLRKQRPCHPSKPQIRRQHLLSPIRLLLNLISMCRPILSVEWVKHLAVLTIKLFHSTNKC